jgi:phosphatidylserine/phosphatidylglycerophosphate/cardiolipin synthase-like enzyme
MKSVRTAIIGGLLALAMVLAVALPAVHADPLPLDGATIESAFAPGKSPAALVAQAIGEATSEVRMMTYQLSNGVVINALRDAAGRGVDVRVIVDEATCDASRFPPVLAVLVAAGVEVSCDGQHPIHHNKVVIIDQRAVITGSFNFSPSAERNAENTNVLRGVPALAGVYRAVWNEHRAHSIVRGR